MSRYRSQDSPTESIRAPKKVRFSTPSPLSMPSILDNRGSFNLPSQGVIRCAARSASPNVSKDMNRLNELLSFTQENCIYCHYVRGRSHFHEHVLPECPAMSSLVKNSGSRCVCRDCLSICGNDGRKGCTKKFVYATRGVCFLCGCNQKVGYMRVGNHDDPKKCSNRYAHQSFIWYLWRNHRNLVSDLFGNECNEMGDEQFRKWIGMWNVGGSQYLNRLSTLLLFSYENPLVC